VARVGSFSFVVKRDFHRRLLPWLDRFVLLRSQVRSCCVRLDLGVLISPIQLYLLQRQRLFQETVLYELRYRT